MPFVSWTLGLAASCLKAAKDIRAKISQMSSRLRGRVCFAPADLLPPLLSMLQGLLQQLYFRGLIFAYAFGDIRLWSIFPFTTRVFVGTFC